MNFEPTEEQRTIVDFAKDSDANICINALAGAAKTTTLELICHAVTNIPILSLAFNKRIADELSKRLPPHVECRTFNSLGHRVWSAAINRRLTVNTNKMHEALKRAVEDLPRSKKEEGWDDFADTLRWLRFAKRDGYVPAKWRGVAQHVLTSDWSSYDEEPTELQAMLIESAMNQSIEQAYVGVIDYDDQIYMPVIFGATWPRFPLVLCDETQDLSAINHVMLEELVDKRVIIVGDPWQSIYAFRGAVQGGMAALVAKFNMVEFPLSMTFRVPKKGVERAKFRVPHMRAPEWQIEGLISNLEEWRSDNIPEGAAIICRNNAPLFRTGLRLLKSQRSIKLVGMDIGPSLVRTMKKLGPLSGTAPEIDRWLESWLTAELKRAKNPDIVYDKYECLQVLCLNPNARNLGEAITLAQDLFKREGAIQLLSGHKAKGLEWETVFHLDSWRIPSKWVKEGTEAWEQEMNVRYVIETRFKKEMFFIDSENFSDRR
jgi:DNA helicase II / ATP-dependent DNA helicase PcrA